MAWQGHEVNFRAIAGVIVGVIVWWLLFYVLEIYLWMLWVGLRSVTGQTLAGVRFDPFPAVAVVLNILLFLIDGVAVGWLVSKISRNFVAVLVVAGFFLLYWLWKTYQHHWGASPNWYQVLMPWIIAGAIVQGGRLSRRISTASA